MLLEIEEHAFFVNSYIFGNQGEIVDGHIYEVLYTILVQNICCAIIHL